MQSHEDMEHQRAAVSSFMERLKERADAITREERSQITAGKPGEDPLEEWQTQGVNVMRLPDDEQQILRVSIGGGHSLVPLNYCVFRGNRQRCIELLKTAIRAMERKP